MEKIAIPFGEKIIDKSFQTSISDAIDSLDKWIKIGKKIRDSESMKLIKRTMNFKEIKGSFLIDLYYLK